jgi:hypothetical protein
MQKVLTRKQDQPTDVEPTVKFTFKGTNYTATLLLSITAALASLPCERCAKSTRDFMREIDVEMPSDDMQVDVGEILSALPPDVSRSAADPEYVCVISNAMTTAITDDDHGVEIPQTDSLTEEIEEHIANKLNRHVVCNCHCFEPGFLGSLLSR